MRILVVEDDAPVRDGLLDVLLEEGHEPVGAANGAVALELLRDGLRPDVILLDLMMPVMSGPELRAALKRDAALAGIPVVVVSAVSDLTLAQARGDGSLRKPLDLDELLATLARVVHDSRLRS
jgi:CheY-like chemotaxis protein